MLIHVDAHDPRPLYVQIVDEVRRALVLGTLGPEEALPSIRQLASELRVNPNTVAQAYRELERSGLVRVRRGQGTFARDGVAADEEREALARAVAERALRDARRNGIDAWSLVDAIRAVARASARETPRPPRAGVPVEAAR
jgi:GntR family transcriptional regulator